MIEHYRCPKCNCLFEWADYFDLIGIKIPFCPKCYEKHLKKYVSIGIKEYGPNKLTDE